MNILAWKIKYLFSLDDYKAVHVSVQNFKLRFHISDLISKFVSAFVTLRGKTAEYWYWDGLYDGVHTVWKYISRKCLIKHKKKNSAKSQLNLSKNVAKYYWDFVEFWLRFCWKMRLFLEFFTNLEVLSEWCLENEMCLKCVKDLSDM